MPPPSPEDQPAAAVVPLFGTWRRAYWAVVAALVLDITLLYTVTRCFA